ncbi:MAG TPA: DNA-3-methyladenine glycosylase 2 family protein [Streptosporangiaceae bacterium]|nr:DNA-3-methyladenine glycosylase 2 family protein [Streptosporangiaceae bacterium]
MTAAVPLATERRWSAPCVVEVLSALSVHRRGYGDPAFAIDDSGAIWRACHTPEGAGTLRVAWRAAAELGTVVAGTAWGPGAGWLLEALPGMVGGEDRPEEFVPSHPVLIEMARRRAGFRIGRTGLVFESLVPAVLEQKVVGKEASRAYRTLLRWYGEPAPGPAPAGMRVPPPASAWASIPSWDWHRAGVEGVRARTIAEAASVAGRLEEIAFLPAAAADLRLRSLPGIGAWTSAEVRQRACGDPDAVSVGDYHLPGQVGWALLGREVDDAGMLELLAPYAGQRHRASILAISAGAGPPRRGPRNAARDYRSI